MIHGNHFEYSDWCWWEKNTLIAGCPNRKHDQQAIQDKKVIFAFHLKSYEKENALLTTHAKTEENTDLILAWWDIIIVVHIFVVFFSQ